MKIFDGNDFVSFEGILNQGQSEILMVEFTDNSFIKVSTDHKFYSTIENKFIEALDLKVGSALSVDKIVSNITKLPFLETVYDPVNVGNTHIYYSEGNLHSNCSMLYLDEAAFIDNWAEFSASVLPVLSSGRNTKLIMTSTPNGLNHFYEYYVNAKNGTNGFKLLEVRWNDVPGRDEAWKQEVLATINHDLIKFEQEYNVQFIGSSNNLIDGSVLRTIKGEAVSVQPIYQSLAYGYKQYYQPEKGHMYAITVDVSRGKGLDYSAFQVIDISEVPYRQVAVFRNNNITPRDYASFVYQTATNYNTASVLVEVNDIGGQVSDILFYDYGYENILYTESAGSRGKRISIRAGNNVDRGVRTTMLVKSKGCSMLKLLIEQRKLIIVDDDTLDELSTFASKGKSYEAESGKHDDLVMCLVLFSWLTQDDYFKSLTDIDIMSNLREMTEEEIYNELVPAGIFGNLEHDSVEETITVNGIEYNVLPEYSEFDF